ncbi:MAG: phosphoribosylformylglycinamidine synthase subunit PurQ, partial [Evtepia sp.]|nr:phosphoribosylformylglycinamidine synthase subunit PurQ [Evtepia sp.]
VLSPEFKAADHPVYLFSSQDSKSAWEALYDLHQAGKVKAAWAVEHGLAQAVMNMSFGNQIGFQAGMEPVDWYADMPGAIVAELTEEVNLPCAKRLGETTQPAIIALPGEAVSVDELLKLNDGVLEQVYPTRAGSGEAVEPISWDKRSIAVCKHKVARPKAVIPVFPGTNCEYDAAKAMAQAGAVPEIVVIKNLTAGDIAQSMDLVAQKLAQAQMVFLPGGFSGGDEPDGSAKLITSFFRAEKLKDQVHDLLKNRDGLMLGICNGFQALIKLGLVPYGEIVDTDEHCPTLTFNTIGRHQSRLVHTRVASNKSPWLMNTKPGEVYTVPISHGEGRFLASQELVQQLADNGQIATQYVDLAGNPTADIHFNPNNSVWAIEGITSPDGRVLGKMGHSERTGPGLYQNVPGDYDMKLFRSAVEYFL